MCTYLWNIQVAQLYFTDVQIYGYTCSSFFWSNIKMIFKKTTAANAHTQRICYFTFKRQLYSLYRDISHTHTYHSVRKRRLLGWEKMRLLGKFDGRCRVGMMEWDQESSIEQRPDITIYVVQRISDRMKECKGNWSQRKREAVEKKCRTSEGQTDMVD